MITEGKGNEAREGVWCQAMWDLTGHIKDFGLYSGVKGRHGQVLNKEWEVGKGIRYGE